MEPSSTFEQPKAALRARIRAARRALTDAERVARDAAVDAAAVRLAAPLRPGAVVSSYVPTRLEPGTDAMLAAFADRGARVLVPVVTGPDSPLDWADRPGGAVLGPEALADAALVLVPALAVDRRGVRLGQGGGHYDRSLRFADPEARLIAVVGEEELVEGLLPVEPHDERVGWALTPNGLVRLG